MTDTLSERPSSRMGPRDETAVGQVLRARTRVRRRVLKVTAALGVAVFAALSLSLMSGDLHVPLSRLLSAAAGIGDAGEVLVVRELRLPRALLAVLVGGALGMSGAVFQSLARNPLASPDILGITQGASLAAVFCLTIIGLSGLPLSLAATGGALLTAVLIYTLAYRRGLSSYRLVLVGIGIAAVAQAMTQYFWTRAHTHDAASAALWLSGSLNGRGWENIRPVVLMLLVVIPFTLILAKQLNILELGDDSAASVGLPVQRSRALLLLAAVALAGAAVGGAGPVAFVAFVAAPIARRLSRSPWPAIVPAALMGALIVVVSDLVGRVALADTEVSVGIITGIVGAPYLLWLLATTNSSGRGD